MERGFGEFQNLDMIEDEKFTWIVHSLEDGDPIPEPQRVVEG
jgi:hypothetical protein